MIKNYFTVNKETENVIIIERSKFICNIKRVNDESDARAYVEEIRKRHTLATHYCYAYIADEDGLIQKFSDDGEPQGTAGLPMLDVLKNKKMHKTVAVVTRYFGGIKLGTGGLTRAYASSVAEALKVSEVVNMCLANYKKVELDYDKYSRFLKLLNTTSISIVKTNFDNNVSVEFAIKEEETQKFIDKVTDYFNGKIEFVTIGAGYYSFKE